MHFSGHPFNFKLQTYILRERIIYELNISCYKDWPLELLFTFLWIKHEHFGG